MNHALLNLDTLINRPAISIDGKRYEILAPEELPVLTSHMLAARGRRMDELMKSAELSGEEKEELVAIVAELSGAIMEPVPLEIREKLSDAQRVSVIEAFTALLLSKKAGTAAALMGGLMPVQQSTGAKPSPGSKGSTAAHRNGGSKKRRSRS